MATIAEIRAQYPQYQDMSDQQLADALYSKHYSDMPRADFDAKVGLSTGSTPPEGARPGTREYADWAAQRARAGHALPQISNPKFTQTESSILDPLAQGMTMGWGDEIASAVHGAGAALQGGDFGSTYAQAMDHYANALQHERRVNPVGAFATELAGALPGGFGVGGLVKGATTMARAGTGLLAGGAQGAIYGAGSAEGDLADRAEGAIWGAGIGGAVGAAAPIIGQAARKLVSPSASNATQQAAAEVLEREGVVLTAGQRTGNKGLQYLESELGKGRAADLMEQQAEQFTQAVLKRAGINAPRATPEVVDEALTTIGKRFDGMAAMTRTPFDRQLQTELAQVVGDYLDTAEAITPAVQKMLGRVVEVARNNGGVLSGEAYKKFRTELGRLISVSRGSTQDALRDMQAVLDDAIERNTSGQTLKAWQALRNQYRNLLVVERAVTGAGQSGAAGLITPAQLRVATISKMGRRSFARGKNDFTELANAGIQTMAPLPQSGTAPRMAAQALGAVPAALGAVAGSPGGIPGAIGGAMAGMAVPAALGRAILSRPGRAYLSNQIATGPEAGTVEKLIRSGGIPAINAGR